MVEILLFEFITYGPHKSSFLCSLFHDIFSFCRKSKIIPSSISLKGAYPSPPLGLKLKTIRAKVVHDFLNKIMKEIILTVQVVVSIILIILILTQNKDGGLSAGMGGGGSFESVKRGAEKVIYTATIIFAAIFLINALLIAFV